MSHKLAQMIATITLAIATVLIITNIFTIYHSHPTIGLPLKGLYTTAEYTISCDGMICHYYRFYQTEVSRDRAVTVFIRNQWNCREIRNEKEADTIFTLPIPYWECEDSIFPKGKAYVAIGDTQQWSGNVQITLYVYWNK